MVEETTPTGNPDGPIVEIGGDSITCQSDANCAANGQVWGTNVLHPMLDPTYRVQVDALVGITITNWHNRFFADAVASAPQVVVLNLGTNNEADAATEIAAYQSLVSDLRTHIPGVCVIGVTVKAQDLGGYGDATINSEFDAALPGLVDHVADWNAIVLQHPEYEPASVHPIESAKPVLAQLYLDTIPLCTA
jgi:hypothetical protein